MLNKAREEYEELLRRHPDQLREYRKIQEKQGGQTALFGLPSLAPGRPRHDDFAIEASELERAGLSQAHIAEELNRRYPNRRDKKGNPSAFTEGAVRKMLSRRRKTAPDKT